MLLQANDFRHLHDDLRRRAADGRLRPVGQHHRRDRPDPPRRPGAPAHGLTWPLLLRSDGQKFGKSTGGAVWLDPPSAPARTSSTSTGCRPTTPTSPSACCASACARSTRSRRSSPSTRRRPERRVAQRALAHELTELVHGADAADAADAAADVLFGGDPTAASAAALDVVRRRGADDARCEPTSSATRSTCSSTTGLATRRATPAGCSSSAATRANGAQLGRRRRPRRGAAAARPLPAAAQGQAHVPPRRDFSAPEVDVRWRRSIAFNSAPTGRYIPAQERHRHQRRSPRATRRVPELRLLENGREDETPVRAASRTDLSGRPRRRCLSILWPVPTGHNTNDRSRCYITGRQEQDVGTSFCRACSHQSFRRPLGEIEPVLDGEFDPGSGRTLAACLTHASRTRSNHSQD